MSCSGKCNECNTKKEDPLKSIIDEVLKSSASRLRKEYQGEGETKVFVPKIIEMCEEQNNEVVQVKVHPEYLAHVVFYNHEYLDLRGKQFKVKPEYAKGMDILIMPDARRNIIDVDIRDMGALYAGDNIERLAEYIMEKPKSFKGIRLSTQTLDAVIEKLSSNYDAKVSVLDDSTVLMPCYGGVKVVKVDETLQFGYVVFTNRI